MRSEPLARKGWPRLVAGGHSTGNNPLAPPFSLSHLALLGQVVETIPHLLRVAIDSEMSIEIFENLIPAGFKSLRRVFDGKSLVGKNQFAVGTQVPQVHSYQRLLIVPS